MVQFRFRKTAPPQDMFDNIQKLNSLGAEAFDQLISALLTFLAREAETDLTTLIQDFSDKNGQNFAKIKSASLAVLVFFQEAVKENLSPLFIKEDLHNFGIKDEFCEIVSGKWKKMFIALSRSGLSNTLMVNQVVDMEWKVGVTTSSNDLGKVGSTYLQLKLVLDKGNDTKEDVFMEMTLLQFYEFLAQMQKAKNSLDFFQ